MKTPQIVTYINAHRSLARASTWTARAANARKDGKLGVARSYLAIARMHIERAESLMGRFPLANPPAVIDLNIGADGVWS